MGSPVCDVVNLASLQQNTAVRVEPPVIGAVLKNGAVHVPLRRRKPVAKLRLVLFARNKLTTT
jgi:2-hydroxychromene-2-carboxylate isomerase